jgi:putative spermidine/putrescine transport system permease protein
VTPAAIDTAPERATATGLWRRYREAPAAWLPALPLLLLIAVLLFAPAIWLIVQSVWAADGFTLAQWQETLGSRITHRAILTSLELAALSATIATLVGAPAAWRISRLPIGMRSAWLALLNVAANFGGIGLAFGYLATIGRVGMVTLVLHSLGVEFRPPRSASFTGLAIAYQYVNIPLFILLTIPAMGVLREEWWEAAQTSAATRAQFWRYVGLPLLAPFIAGGWLLIFTWSIGIYAIAYAMAGESAGALIHLLTLEMGVGIKNYAIVGFAEPAVYGVLLLAWAMLALLCYRALVRRTMRWL